MRLFKIRGLSRNTQPLLESPNVVSRVAPRRQSDAERGQPVAATPAATKLHMQAELSSFFCMHYQFNCSALPLAAISILCTHTDTRNNLGQSMLHRSTGCVATNNRPPPLRTMPRPWEGY